MNKKED